MLLALTSAGSARAEEGGSSVIAQPSLRLGDWAERVEIEVPPAARDVAPKIALVGSHRTVDSEGGSGWRLEATSVIRRRSLTNGVPQRNSDPSLFTVDGTELVWVTSPGAPHYQPEVYDGSRYDYDASSNSWTRRRDGWTWTYGESGVYARRPLGQATFGPGGCSGLCNTEAWYLTSVVDPFGNRIDYTYEIPAMPSALSSKYVGYTTSEHLVSTITYAAGAASVSFHYELRPDLRVDLSGGIPVFTTQRLHLIVTHASGQLYSRYLLQYEDEGDTDPIFGTLTDCDNNAVSEDSTPEQSLLRKILRIDGTGDMQRVVRCNRYHHRSFSLGGLWDSSYDQPIAEIQTPLSPIDFPEDVWTPISIDLDSDAITDLITINLEGGAMPNHRVYIATPRRASPFTGSAGGGNAAIVAQDWEARLGLALTSGHFEFDRGHAIVDIDADGSPELIYEDPNVGGVLIESYVQGSFQGKSNNLDPCDLRYGEVTDVDGDRRPDVIVRVHGSDTNGCGATTETKWVRNQGSSPWFDSSQARTLKMPLELATPPAEWSTLLSVECGGLVQAPQDYNPTWTPQAYVADQARFSDFNDDGITDVAYSLYGCWTIDGDSTLGTDHWAAVSDSAYSRIFLGNGWGEFIDSGLSAGPPVLLDTKLFGETEWRMTPGVLGTLDSDRDGHAELLQSYWEEGAVDGLPEGLGYQVHRPGGIDVGFGMDAPTPDHTAAYYAGNAWDCHHRTTTPTFGDFDGDGFLDMLYLEFNAEGGSYHCPINTWCAVLRPNQRDIAEGRLIASDNEHGGRTHLEWGFSTMLPNTNPDLPVSLEVIQSVSGPGGTRTMSYHGGVRQGDQLGGFEEVSVTGDRGGTEVYSFITAPWARGAQHLGVRYRENGSAEHVTILSYGLVLAGAIGIDVARPYFNPLYRRCEVDVGFDAVNVDQLVESCSGIGWLAPSVIQTGTVELDPDLTLSTERFRMLLGHDRAPATTADMATFAKVWGATNGSYLPRPRLQVAAPLPLDTTMNDVRDLVVVATGSGYYRWPIPSAIYSATPDVAAAEAAYAYPPITVGARDLYAWDFAHDYPVRRLVHRYEHRDLATTGDDRRVSLAHAQPFTDGYWYALTQEITRDAAAAPLGRLTRSDFAAFDVPRVVERCGVSAGDCTVDSFEYGTNGTLSRHVFPDLKEESWNRLSWCGRPTTHTDEIGRITTYGRDTRCVLESMAKEGASWSFDHDALLRPIKVTVDPGAGLGTSYAKTFYYDDQLTYQSGVDAREDSVFAEPRRAERRSDGLLDLYYLDGLGRLTRLTRCADTGVDTTGGSTDLVSCQTGTERHLEWNLYGSDGLLKVKAGPLEPGEVSATYGYGHDGQGRRIVVLEPAHEPGAPAWRTDTITYGAGYEKRTEPATSGTVTSQRNHSTLAESWTVAGAFQGGRTFDALGLVTQIEEADGAKTALEYDGQHRLAREVRVDAAGAPVIEDVLLPDGTVQNQALEHRITARDLRGRVTTEVLPDGTVLEYGYDAVGRMTGRKVDGVPVQSWLYTSPTQIAPGTVRETNEEIGSFTSLAIDGLGRTLSRFGPSLNDTLSYDSAGRLASITDGNGVVTQYGYDGQDRVDTIDDPRTGLTTLDYDGLGRLISRIDADGVTETFSYVYSGLLHRHYQGDWLVTENAYDPHGRVTRSTDGGVVNVRKYDDLGRITKLREGVEGSAELKVTNYFYDDASRLTLMEQMPVAGLQVATTEIRYDAWGRAYEVVDPASGIVGFQYDAAGRLRRRTDQESAALDTLYDARGRVTDRQLPGGGWEHFRYHGRQTYRGTPNCMRIDRFDDEEAFNGDRTERYFDGLGNLLAEVRPDGTEKRWPRLYDRILREELYRSDGTIYSTKTYGWGTSGRLDSFTQGPYAVLYQYTAAGRIERITTPDDVIDRTYEDGRLASETQNGVTHRYLRDSLGWVHGEAWDGAGATRFAEIFRDRLGRITQLQVGDGAGPQVTKTFTAYDYYDNPWFEQASTNAGNVTQVWTYDVKGRPLTRHTSGTGLAGQQTSWTWFANDELQTIQTPSLQQITYDYGTNFDHQVDRLLLNGVVVAEVTSRDLRGAPLTVDLPTLNEVKTFDHDVMGRVALRSRGPTPPPNAMFEWSGSYHPDGRLATETISDLAGLSIWTNEYGYDAAGRLIHEVVGRTNTTYDYLLDAAGNRLTTHVNGALDMTAAYQGPKLTQVDTATLTYDPWNAVSRDHHGNRYYRTGDGELSWLLNGGSGIAIARDARGIPVATAEPGSVLRRTTWGLSPAGLPLEVDDGGGTVATYLSVDGVHIGTSASGVLSPVETDGRSTVLKHGGEVLTVATAFGAGTIAPTGSDERFMYGMLERVPSVSQVMLARRRTYDPVIGRFLEPDPIGAAGGLEIYQYGGGDPVNFVDPMGLAAVATQCTTGGVGGIGGGGVMPRTYDLEEGLFPKLIGEMIADFSQTKIVGGPLPRFGFMDIDISADLPDWAGPLCVVNCGSAESDSDPNTEGSWGLGETTESKRQARKERWIRRYLRRHEGTVDSKDVRRIIQRWCRGSWPACGSKGGGDGGGGGDPEDPGDGGSVLGGIGGARERIDVDSGWETRPLGGGEVRAGAGGTSIYHASHHRDGDPRAPRVMNIHPPVDPSEVSPSVAPVPQMPPSNDGWLPPAYEETERMRLRQRQWEIEQLDQPGAVDRAQQTADVVSDVLAGAAIVVPPAEAVSTAIDATNFGVDLAQGDTDEAAIRGPSVLNPLPMHFASHAALGIVFRKAVNSNLPHAIDRAVEHGIFGSADEASAAIRELTDQLSRTRTFPAGTLRDTAHADRVLVPIGNRGLAVYQILRNGTARLKTVLIAR